MSLPPHAYVLLPLFQLYVMKEISSLLCPTKICYYLYLMSINSFKIHQLSYSVIRHFFPHTIWEKHDPFGKRSKQGVKYSWRMFPVHLRRYILLHLNGMSWRYQWYPSNLMYHLRLVFPYFLFWWSVHWCEWGVKVS